MATIFEADGTEVMLSDETLQEIAETYAWPYEWEVASKLKAERDEARHWAHLWKMKAKRERIKARRMKLERDSWRQQRDLMYAKIQELEALVERDTQKEREAHAELMAALKAWGPDVLAAASAAEVDAVQRAQELERELHEVRAHLIKSRAAVMEERDELKRLLTAALKENPTWYTQAAVDAERLLGIRDPAE